MAIGNTVEHKVDMVQRDFNAATNVRLALCDSSSWSSPPTETEIIASTLTEANGYTEQDVAPVTAAVSNGQQAEIAYNNASISLTSSTLNYTGYAIIRNRGTDNEVISYESFSSTRTIDSAGAAHQFNNLKYIMK